MTPLRIGILGASRIAPDALFAPALLTGDRLVAVAARNRDSAESYARQHGIERVVADYRAVINDPEVDVIYNALPNGLHAPWNIEAMRAGKHVLTEKPSASTAAEASSVLDVQRETGMRFMEAFHYRYHPLMNRMVELATSGEIGTLQHVDIVMGFPLTWPEDPRWSFDLAGGSLMDVGCYAVHALRTLSHALAGTPEVLSGNAVTHEPDDRVDAELTADLTLAPDVTGHFRSSFLVPEMTFTLELQGSQGAAFAHNFCKPGIDNTITLTRAGETTTEHPGEETSYTYQLQAFATHLRSGGPNHSDAADALLQAAVIDACYSAAGLPLRPESRLPA
jgi:predicted dehydrogenase